MIAQVCRS